jgi:hypothetical protein
VIYRVLETEPQQYAFMVLYVAREEIPSAGIHSATEKIIGIFLKKHRKFNALEGS